MIDLLIKISITAISPYCEIIVIMSLLSHIVLYREVPPPTGQSKKTLWKVHCFKFLFSIIIAQDLFARNMGFSSHLLSLSMLVPVSSIYNCKNKNKSFLNLTILASIYLLLF